MRIQVAALCGLAMISGLVAATKGRAAQPAAPGVPALGRFAVEARSWVGDIRGGPWEWSKEVKVTSSDLTMTCDSLKAWPTKDRRDWERVEASGRIEIRGRYMATDKTEWKVVAKAEAASYDAIAGQGVLRGAVDFQATNLSTGAVLSATGEKLVYDTKTRQFRFERGERPVRVEWQQPAKERSEGGSSESATPKSEESK